MYKYNQKFDHEELFESLNYKDLEGMLKPTIHVDEFNSKMGEDEDIIVISFFVRDKQAAKDLMNWFEKGYDFVLDADRSPGEIKTNRYLVYIELRRRSTAPSHIKQMLEDLNTLTEFNVDDWVMHYNNEEMPFTEENFAKVVPLSPKDYRAKFETDLNDLRTAAGMEPKPIHDKKKSDIKSIQSAAGVI
jgi:hypothetical protein